MNTAKEKFKILLSGKAIRNTESEDHVSEQIQLDEYDNIVSLFVNTETNEIDEFPNSYLDEVFQWKDEHIQVVDCEPYRYQEGSKKQSYAISNKKMMESMLNGKAIYAPFIDGGTLKTNRDVESTLQ